MEKEDFIKLGDNYYLYKDLEKILEPRCSIKLTEEEYNEKFPEEENE